MSEEVRQLVYQELLSVKVKILIFFETYKTEGEDKHTYMEILWKGDSQSRVKDGVHGGGNGGIPVRIWTVLFNIQTNVRVVSFIGD